MTRVAATDGPSGLVHLLLTHDGGATSAVSLTLDAPPEATTRDFVFFGENGVVEVPPGDGNALTAFSAAIDQLAEEIDSGTRDHRCDVRFGREVVAVLVAAETARAEGRTVDLPG